MVPIPILDQPCGLEPLGHLRWPKACGSACDGFPSPCAALGLLKRTRWLIILLEIFAPADKWTALLALGVKPDQVATVGDGHNDLRMLSSAPWSFAPDDGDSEAKSRAKCVVSSHRAGAVAEAVAHLLEDASL